jgi:hypothetical protein
MRLGRLIFPIVIFWILGALYARRMVVRQQIGGTYSFISTFYHKATITFENGSFHAEGTSDNEDRGRLTIDGTYQVAGNNLRMTIGHVSDETTGMMKAFAEGLDEDVQRLQQAKTLDFVWAVGPDDRINLYSGDHGPGPKGELNAILFHGSPDQVKNYAISLEWLPSYNFVIKDPEETSARSRPSGAPAAQAPPTEVANSAPVQAQDQPQTQTASQDQSQNQPQSQSQEAGQSPNQDSAPAQQSADSNPPPTEGQTPPAQPTTGQ